MTAGRGIVHSERSPPEAPGGALHGLQLWVALPREREDSEPSFEHHPAASLPVVSPAGARLSICCGSAYGATSAVQVSAPLFFVDASLEAGATLELPPEHAERALYLVEGTVEVFGQTVEARTMIVFGSGPAPVRATTKARAVLLGGAPPDGPRHMWWNFVSSSPEKIEQAKRDWHLGRFAPIPGDDQERTPLP
jgi:redox-sensitive bicupin YhaK (pirin superfamily)